MFAEFTLLALVLGELAGLLALDDWLQPLFVIVFSIAAASGIQYVWIWSAKARRERAASLNRPDSPRPDQPR
jgi:cardiolipin synthase